MPKNMMYLTDRLPKANYDEDSPNDASHLSLPSINGKYNATTSHAYAGMTGKSGSISPLRGQSKKKLATRKKSLYSLK